MRHGRWSARSGSQWMSTASGSSSWVKGFSFTSATSCGTARRCACTWSAIIRSAACSPTATAAPTTGWCFRWRKGYRRHSRPGRLALRHPGHPQALSETRPRGEVGRIIARFPHAEAMDGEAGIEPESGLHGGPWLVGEAKMGEDRPEQEMSNRLIAIRLEAEAHPCGGFRVGIELELGEAENPHPAEGEDIARRQPQRLPDMGFCFRGPATKIF